MRRTVYFNSNLLFEIGNINRKQFEWSVRKIDVILVHQVLHRNRMLFDMIESYPRESFRYASLYFACAQVQSKLLLSLGKIRVIPKLPLAREIRGQREPFLICSVKFEGKLNVDGRCYLLALHATVSIKHIHAFGIRPISEKPCVYDSHQLSWIMTKNSTGPCL